MSMARSSRMLHYVNYRMRITLQDSRILVGVFLAFDKHMNIVVSDTEEYRTIKSKKGQGLVEEKHEKRTLGLIILRGDTVVSMTIEGPPPPETDEKATPGGPGIAKPAGRGVPAAMAAAQPGLAGPVRGVGGPISSIMQPPMQVAAAAAPQGMPRPPMPMHIPGMPPGMAPGMPPPRFPPPPMPGMPAGVPMPPGMLPPPPRGPPGMFPPGPPPPRG